MVLISIMLQKLRMQVCMVTQCSSNCIKCSCSMFEFSGIQDRHVIKVLIIIDILTRLDEYILKRWIKNVKSTDFSHIPLISFVAGFFFFHGLH